LSVDSFNGEKITAERFRTFATVSAKSGHYRNAVVIDLTYSMNLVGAPR
jgi:hypothetical protein